MALGYRLLVLGSLALALVSLGATSAHAAGTALLGCSAAGFGTGLQFFLLVMVLWGLLRHARKSRGGPAKRRSRRPLGVALVLGGLLLSSSNTHASSSAPDESDLGEVEQVLESSRFDELTAKLPSSVRIVASGQRLLFNRLGVVEVYVADGDRWLLESTLYTQAVGGQSVVGVALHRNRAIVATLFAIRTYVFDGAWHLEEIVDRSSQAPLGQNGEAQIALHEDVFVVSTNYELEVFERTAGAWKAVEILWLEGRTPDAGGPVSISSSIMLKARQGYDRIYVFHKRGGKWFQEGELTGGTGFGSQLSVFGDRAAVTEGAEVHTYRRKDGNWERTDTVCSPGGGTEAFGSAMTMVGRRLLVGAPFAAGDEVQSGAAFLYVREGEEWILREKLLSSDGRRFDGLGHYVGLLDDRAVVQAPAHEVAGGLGELYEFELLPIGNGSVLGCSASSHSSSSGLGFLLVALTWCLLGRLRNSSHNMGKVRSRTHKCAGVSACIWEGESGHTLCTTALHYDDLSTKHLSRCLHLRSNRMRPGLDNDKKHQRRLLL